MGEKNSFERHDIVSRYAYNYKMRAAIATTKREFSDRDNGVDRIIITGIGMKDDGSNDEAGMNLHKKGEAICQNR